ncbi:MAG: xanthine dehydrogenase family protein molybdopterin-binding subunit [Acidimicrobiia bacterium]
MSILGNPVLRREDPRLITEGGTFVEDVPLENPAWVTYVRSTMAHARITAIDVSEARQAPGVLGVFTRADLGTALDHLPHILPVYTEATVRPLLASEVVRNVGEPIVAVVAEDRYAAADAAELVVVDYEPLPVVIDPEDAARDEVLLFPAHGTNTVATMGSKTEADFADAEVVVELRIENTRMSAAPLEPRSGAARWDGDKLTVWSACQGAHPTRDALCAVYGLPKEQVRVIVPDMGGGFGAKSRTPAETVMLGALARAVGRPVRWTETRSENMVAMPHGRGQRQYARLGGTRDGRITAYAVEVFQEAGAYPMIGGFLPNMTMRMLCGTYDIANVSFKGRSVATNTMSTTAFRGAGRPEATVAIERMIDAFADEIGMDPVEVRLKNLIDPFDTKITTGIGTDYDVGDFPAALRKVVDHADYAGLRAEQARRRDRGDRLALGVGVICYVEITAGGPAGEFGSVEVLPGGKVTVRTGSTAMGQGHATAMAMIAADRLGVAIGDVEVICGDTDEVPAGGMTTGSRSVQITGSTVADAAAKVIDLARQVAADRLEANPDDVVFDPETARFHVAGTPAVAVDWATVADASPDALLAVGTFAAPMPTFPFGAHLAVVEVDLDTGKATLVRLVGVDDAGRILNPMMAEGQVHGGMAQGVAQALLESIIFDEDGNPLTSNFADYSIISAAELPSFEVLHMETPTWVNELGAKGVGESGTIGAIPAVQNAVIDAVSHLGVRHLDMPITPQRVWEAIRAARRR